jgi:hypothetical protein
VSVPVLVLETSDHCTLSLVDGSVGWIDPGLFLILFHPTHLDSDVRLFIDRTPVM